MRIKHQSTKKHGGVGGRRKPRTTSSSSIKGTVPFYEGTEVVPSSWMLPDRAGFSDWVTSTFRYDSPSSDGLFKHQRFVRDYMQKSSPYAGIVLYHVMGVGKTCAAVAALRALDTHFRVVVLLPATLQKNFITEVRKCGGPKFSEKQHWKRAANASSTKPLWERAAAHQGGVHYDDLDADDRSSVRNFLTKEIRSRMTFINYDGLNEQRVHQLTSTPENMFDGAAVVIDEAHNFISSVSRGKLVARLYERMMSADPRKIILLTGTPFMNNIREFPYLINLAHGSLRMLDVTFRVPPGVSAESAVPQALQNNVFVNRVNIAYRRGTTVAEIQVTPNGFVRDVESKNGAVYMLGGRDGREFGSGAWLDRARPSILEDMKDAGLQVDRVNARNEMLLPVGDDFLHHFSTSSGFQLKNVDLLSRRVAGTVSYFGVFNPELYPQRGMLQILECPMSERQFNEYKVLRDKERKSEDRAARFASMRGESSSPDDDKPSTYRSDTRQACNFVFPENFPRPSRKGMKLDDGPFSPSGFSPAASGSADSDVESSYDEAMDRAIRALKTERSSALFLTPPDSPGSLDPQAAQRQAVSQQADGLRQHSPKFSKMLDHFEAMRLAGNVYPTLVYSSFRRTEGIGLLAAAMDVNGYTRLSLKRSPETNTYRLVEGDGHADDSNGGVLNNSSKKNNALTKIQARGGASTHQQEHSRDSRHARHPRDTKGRYMVYDNKDPAATDIMKDLFNSEFSKLPSSVAKDAQDILERSREDNLQKDNLHGALVRFLMITKSGAEGINLKNVREVHVMEPFWHANRVDQVMGRAVRAESHVNLPPEERRVDMYMYMATFTKDQLDVDNMLERRDAKLTTDQAIFELNNKKRLLVEQMLRVITSASADCQIHEKEHALLDPAHRCVRPWKNVPPDAFAYSLDVGDDTARAESSASVSSVSLSAVKAPDGKLYYIDKGSHQFYDYDMLKLNGQLVPVPSPL